MNERPIRIVTSEQHGVNTVYQMGARLPQPAPFPEEPLVIVDIDEYDDDEDGENDVVIVLSVGEEGSVYQKNDVGFMTRIPTGLVVRRDSAVSATELVEALAEKARQMRAETEAQEAQDQLEAQAQAQEAATQQAPELAQSQGQPAMAEAPDQQSATAVQGVPDVTNGGL